MAKALITFFITVIIITTGFYLASEAYAQSIDVEISDTAFVPNDFHIGVGDQVHFNHTNVNHHEIWYESKGNVSTAVLELGQLGSWTETFKDPGTYEFWCETHKGSGMVGKITVD